MPATRPGFGTTTVMGGLPLSETLSARALYVHAIRIGESPDATFAVLAMIGTKLPASLSFLKKSRPGVALSSEPPLAMAAAHTPEIAWFETVGSPARATWPLYSGLRRSLQSCGTLATLAVFTSNARTP